MTELALILVNGLAAGTTISWIVLHVRTIGLRVIYKDMLTMSVIALAILTAIRLILHVIVSVDNNGMEYHFWVDISTNALIGVVFAHRIWIWWASRRRLVGTKDLMANTILASISLVTAGLIIVWLFVHIRHIGWKVTLTDPLSASIVSLAAVLSIRLLAHAATILSGTYQESHNWLDLVTVSVIAVIFAHRIWFWWRAAHHRRTPAEPKARTKAAIGKDS